MDQPTVDDLILMGYMSDGRETDWDTNWIKNSKTGSSNINGTIIEYNYYIYQNSTTNQAVISFGDGGKGQILDGLSGLRQERASGKFGIDEYQALIDDLENDVRTLMQNGYKPTFTGVCCGGLQAQYASQHFNSEATVFNCSGVDENNMDWARAQGYGEFHQEWPHDDFINYVYTDSSDLLVDYGCKYGKEYEIASVYGFIGSTLNPIGTLIDWAGAEIDLKN